MRGDITLKILEMVGRTAVGLSDVVEAMLSAGYGASSGKLRREIGRIEAERERGQTARQREAQLKHRYQSMLSRLKAQGLIIESGSRLAGQEKVGTILKLTSKGRGLLDRMKKSKKENLLPEKNYSSKGGGVFTIVAFDVPEKYHSRRDWLRACLANMGLKMIQRSVWLGKVKIPKDFIEDLKKLDLLEAVEIFEISKSGTLIDRA